MHGIETPALLLDEERLLANLDRMAALAGECKVALRPHWKTHKCVEIARLQEDRGAVGGTVAKAGEAEVFLAAGFRDVLIATPVVDPRKIERLLAARGAADLRIMIESEEGRSLWSAAAAQADRPVPVRLEVDVGMGRTGVAPVEAAVPLARAIHESLGLELEGVLTHAGHGYGAGSEEELARIGREEGEILVATAEAIRAAGLPCPVVSVGSTPTVGHSARVPGVTEIRPGNYAFLDGVQVSLGVAPLAHVALSVLATVTARPAPDRVILDSGAKTLSADNAGGRMKGYGQVVGRPELRIAKLSEEHGILPVPPDADLAIGDRVRVIPNHACVCTNLHDEYVVVRDGDTAGRWKIAARGRVT